MRVSRRKVDIIMASRGLTQSKLAEVAKMSRTNLSIIINGKNCRPATITKIAVALGVDAKEIIETENY